ncbi:hypothetical protein TNCV_1460501 [Trichonephila clavipes]|nr:hypothetical protein TNCV_1460501 [Trichonephila clavipes]
MKYYEKSRVIGNGTAGNTLVSYCLALAMSWTTVAYDAKSDYAENFKLGESRNMVKARKRCVFSFLEQWFFTPAPEELLRYKIETASHNIPVGTQRCHQQCTRHHAQKYFEAGGLQFVSE